MKNLKNLAEKEDPRVKRTRALIVTSFEALLAEKGFDSVTVQDVTDKAEINRATFYAHFPDKYALLDYAVQKAFMAAIEKRNLDMCNYSPDNLRHLILIVCDFLVFLHNGCAHSNPQFESLIGGTIKKQIFELLSHWLRKSKLPTELPVTVATWAIYGLASHYSHLEKRPALEKFVDQAHPLVAVNLEQFA
ncbi:MAG: TetR/AcrR family transcriptional regulator [Caldilineaceae bacterium]